MTDNCDESGTNLFDVRFVFVHYDSYCLRIFVALQMLILPKFTVMTITLQQIATGFMPCTYSFATKIKQNKIKVLKSVPFHYKT